MSESIFYAYAVTRDATVPEAEAVDGSRHFVTLGHSGLHVTASPVSPEQFSQDAIDARAGDLEWLGAIGYRHQDVVAQLMKQTAIVPLRAFSLFSSFESIDAWLHEHGDMLRAMLDRLDGKQEWTVKVEFDPQRWSDAIVRRAPGARALEEEIASAAPGRAFLLKKKLDEERKNSARAAEEQVVAEIVGELTGRLPISNGDSIAESRQARSGAFPQINLLLSRDEESQLVALRDELNARYEDDGVAVALTGPWPPYSFATIART